MKIAICDDDSIFLGQLENQIRGFFQFMQVETLITLFGQGNDLLKVYQAGERFDVLFMDVHLMDSDGIHVIHKIRSLDKGTPVIFISSLENRAIDGYDVKAFSFISKQNVNEKLPSVLKRLWSEYFSVSTIPVTTDSGTILLNARTILWIESDQRNTRIHSLTDTWMTHTSIQNFAAKLPPELFVESHKSIYVNLIHIKKINTDTLELINGQILPISRRNRKEVLSAVMQRLSK